MRAFLVSVAAAIVIGVLAAVIMENLGRSSAAVFQAEQGNVRL
ncbi:MAG: hypothetical protein ACREH6_08420 [Geminicoccaceae bacterium]